MVWYKYQNPGASAVMREEYARLSEGHADFRLQHEWVPYDKISNSLKRAVVAAEDSNFTEHDGVEWEAIRKAWEYNQKQEEAGRSKMRGGSTITQQLAKNLFLSSSRSYVRKGQELVLTYMIEHVMSKERILELYLNVAEWGVGVFGAEAAAKHYFNTSAAGLGASQSARRHAPQPALLRPQPQLQLSELARRRADPPHADGRYSLNRTRPAEANPPAPLPETPGKNISGAAPMPGGRIC